MKNRILKGILMLGVTCVLQSVVYAETMNLIYDGKEHTYSNKSIGLYIDGKEITTTVMPPIQFSGNVLVPAREVFSEMGAEVEWRALEQSVYVHNETTLIVLRMDSKEAWVNGEIKPLNMPAKLINDKVMIPIRFISEELGYSVEWSPSQYAIYIMTDGSTSGPNQNIGASDVFNGVQDGQNETASNETTNGILNNSYVNNTISNISNTGVDNTGNEINSSMQLPTINSGLTDSWLNSNFIHYQSQSETLTLDGIAGLTASQITCDENYHQKQLVIHLNGDYSSFLQAGSWMKQSGSISKLQVVHQNGETQIILTTSTIQALKVSEQDGQVALSVVKPSEKYDKIVVIDAGHGDHDPGTAWAGVQEKDVTLSVSNAIVSLLEADPTIKVYATREDDSFLELMERSDFSNQIDPDLFISVHVNSVENNTAASGTETYYTEKADTRNKTFATMVQEALVNEFGTRNRGVKTNTFVVTKYTNAPAILIEIGFVTNDADRAMMTSSDFESRYASTLYQCILNYYAQGLN